MPVGPLRYGVLAGLLLHGCVTVGNPSAVDEQAVARLEPSRSTQEDVRRVLGAPTHPPMVIERPAHDLGLGVWYYDYTHVEIVPATLIPVLGPFLGYSAVTSGRVSIRFDAQGVVQNVSRGRSFEPYPAADARILGLPPF